VRLIDVTRGIGPSMRVYPGDPVPRIEVLCDPSRGEPARVSLLHVGTHSGTHIDAPCHLPGLEGGIESIPIEALLGPAFVRGGWGPTVGAGDLSRFPPESVRCLLRGEPVVSPDAARECVRRGIRLLGTEGLSIDPVGRPDMPAHRILLQAGVVVLENLDLTAAPDGSCELFALPALIPGGDGAPARVILRVGS